MTYRIASINNTPVTPSESGFYGDIRLDPSDAAPVYIGCHLQSGAATTDTGWKILKMTSSGGATTRIQMAYGSWDERASLF